MNIQLLEDLLLEELFGEFEPEQAPLHDLFMEALNEVTTLRNDGAITEEEYDLVVRRMVAAVLAVELDSMIADFFSRSHADDRSDKGNHKGRATTRVAPTGWFRAGCP